MEKDGKVKETVKSMWMKLIESDSKESSKRFLALYIVLVLGTIITLYGLWKGVDFIILLCTWLGFAATLLGLSEYTKNRQAKINADVRINGKQHEDTFEK